MWWETLKCTYSTCYIRIQSIETNREIIGHMIVVVVVVVKMQINGAYHLYQLPSE